MPRNVALVDASRCSQSVGSLAENEKKITLKSSKSNRHRYFTL